MQTQDELLVELTISAMNHWAVTPGKKPNTLLVTENNSLLITTSIMNRIKQTGQKPSVDEVDAIVKSLGDNHKGGRLDYAQTEDPKAKKKEAFEIAHSKGFKGGSQNNRTELQRDDDHKPPVLTEQDRQAINARNARLDEIINETLSSIRRYSGPTHSKTYSRRDELTALFNLHKSKVVDVESAEKLARTVAEKIDSYDRSTSGSIR